MKLIGSYCFSTLLSRLKRSAALVTYGVPVALAISLSSSAMASVTLTASPAFVTLHTGASTQFQATLAGETGTVYWHVNGISGGNSTLGTISSSGLYKAPSTVPTGSTVTVTAIAAHAAPINLIVAINTGTSFYVSTTGNDSNAGTLAAPWLTIQHAANMAVAGDTVYVLGGTYHESVSIRNSGSASAGSIVFESYPGQLAIIDGTGVACCSMQIQGLISMYYQPSYLIIEGFELQNFSTTNSAYEIVGVLANGAGSNIQILYNIVHGISGAESSGGSAVGIANYGPSTTPLSHVTITGNQIYGNSEGMAASLLFSGNVNGFTVANNLIHDNDNIGVDLAGFYQTGPTGYDEPLNGDIVGNTIYNISTLNNPAYKSYGADGIYCDGCANTVIEQNRVYSCDQNIEAASENAGKTSSYVTIRNNDVYDANVVGIGIGSYSSGGGSEYITIVNNTILHNTLLGWGNAFSIAYHATNNVFENNIVEATVPGVLFNGADDSTSNPVTADYNIYYGPVSRPEFLYQGVDYYDFSTFQAASGQEKHSSFINPDLVSVIAPLSFNLQYASPARGTGNYSLGSAVYGTVDIHGNPRTSGTTIDIGAVEQ